MALYAAPPCGSGVIVVRFRAVGDSSWSYTNPLPCRPGVTRNFLVAGMRANTAYVMQHLITSPSGTTQSPSLTYTTGSVPPSVTFPPVSVPLAPTSQSDPLHNLVVHMLPLPRPGVADPFATDLSGRLVWYYDPAQAGLSNVMPNSIVPGGTMLLLGSDGLTQSSSVTGSLDVLREIDLAGDTIRETNVDAINAQLQALGQEHIYELHHEALRLPGGNTAVLGQTMQTINGTDVVGDMVIVLDSNFQVIWTWDAFNYAQQISNGNPYHPVLGELCSTGNPAALCAVPDSSALDWLHTNAISYSPADGNLIVSLRHQDWIVKIDYQNGQGDGHVIWRLGKNGDFTISSTDPNPWFSHQHDPHYVGLSTIVLFDNGNTRCTATNGSIITGCDSRGQALKLDEHNRTATLDAQHRPRRILMRAGQRPTTIPQQLRLRGRLLLRPALHPRPGLLRPLNRDARRRQPNLRPTSQRARIPLLPSRRSIPRHRPRMTGPC